MMEWRLAVYGAYSMREAGRVVALLVYQHRAQDAWCIINVEVRHVPQTAHDDPSA